VPGQPNTEAVIIDVSLMLFAPMPGQMTAGPRITIARQSSSRLVLLRHTRFFFPDRLPRVGWL
jgi:hypothetical protein